MKKIQENNQKRRILLVGGAGYIGTALTDYLLTRGYSIKVLDHLLYQNGSCMLPFLSHPNFEFLWGDFTHQNTAQAALYDTTDVIILAGLVGDPITKKYPELSEKINHQGMLRFINQLSDYPLNQVIFISTCSNYGLIRENVLADENWPLKPLSLYAKAKVAVETFLLSQKNKVNYCPTILRFSTAFGVSPRMRFDLTVNEFTRELYLGKELVVYDHETWRPYCHVLDFAYILCKVLEAPKDKINFEVFNVGCERNNYTKAMIVEVVKKYLPNAKVRYQENGADPRNYRVNFEKIKTVLEFKAKYTISDGILETLNALRKNCFQDIAQRPNFYGNYEIYHAISEESVVA